MNKQLRELIKQHGINITVDGLGYGEGNIEGLAELIVKECIDLVEGYTKQRTHTTFYKAEEQIKQHFGVEE